MAGKQINPAIVANPAHLIKLGCALAASVEGEKAIELMKMAVSSAPRDRLLREAASVVLTHQIPQFHRSMLEDAARNKAYATAIAATVTGGESVLDVGTGSGLLAMMAAKAGAAKVVACETNSMLAATAREIVAANGYSSVRVIAKHSTELTTTEVGAPVDVIIHEIFGHNVLGEGVLSSLADAVSRFGRPGLRIIPARASVRVALADYAQVASYCEVIDQYDLSLFSRHMRTETRLKVGSPHLQMRSEPVDLFEFDFSDPSSFEDCRASATVSSDGGGVNGVVQWMCIRFDECISYENRPGKGASSHWKAIFHPFDAVETTAGDRFTIDGYHDRTTLRIWGSSDKQRNACIGVLPLNPGINRL